MSAPHVLSQAEITDSIARCTLHAPHMVPLLQAAYHGVINLAGPSRQGRPPYKMLERRRLPTIVIIGDDVGGGSDTGPDGWAATPGLVRWARHAVINGSVGRVEDYRGAVLLAVQVHKLVLVETGSAHLAAWHLVFARAGVPTVNIVPAGSVHPVQPGRSTLH